MNGFSDFIDGLSNAAGTIIDRYFDFRTLELTSEAQAAPVATTTAGASSSSTDGMRLAVLALAGGAAFLLARELLK